MPNYKYECPSCGHGFIEFQSMTAENLVDCPSCRKPGLKRLIGGGNGVIFKGSGFYSTDYKKGKPAPAEAKQPACADCGAAKQNGGGCPSAAEQT